ncbi:MAG: peptide MFS transporter [Gammaproteobacteria bacterium]
MQQPASAQTGNYHQPKALYWLCFNELWERFGFYTIQTILILYLTKKLIFSDEKANIFYAAFNSLLYITPVIGGYLADRYLGFRRAIGLGGILLMVGYLLTALPSQSMFLFGLSIVACAQGLFKPNVSSIVGDLYAADDPRREGGFTLFYMGINIGAFIPPLIAGWTVDHLGWHSGFLLAALGMLIGVITFAFARKHFANLGSVPPNSPLKNTQSRQGFIALLIGGLILSILLIRLALAYPQTTNILVEITAVCLGLVVLGFLIKQAPAERRRLLAALLLIIISVGFWALYNQTFTSLTLFADRNMGHHLLGIPVNAEAMQFFNPFFIFLLSPFFSFLWIRLGQRGKGGSIPNKFFLGVVFVSLGFWLLAASTHFFAQEGLVSPWWLVASYFLQTIGELLLSPIGLSMITLLAPKPLTGMMMGVWFFSQALSFTIGAIFANLAAVPEHSSTVTSLAIYNHAFIWLGVVSTLLAFTTLLFVPFLNRLINRP